MLKSKRKMFVSQRRRIFISSRPSFAQTSDKLLGKKFIFSKKIWFFIPTEQEYFIDKTFYWYYNNFSGCTDMNS